MNQETLPYKCEPHDSYAVGAELYQFRSVFQQFRLMFAFFYVFYRQ